MNKITIVAVSLAVVIFIIVAFVFANRRNVAEVTTIPTQTPAITTPTPVTQEFKQETFENIKTPHFVSSDPADNALLAKGPSQVTINFNFNLAQGSKISVTANSNDVTTQQGTKISTDKLSMTALINPVQPANYKVSYTACWPDGSCHEGSFGFTVKSSS